MTVCIKEFIINNFTLTDNLKTISLIPLLLKEEIRNKGNVSLFNNLI